MDIKQRLGIMAKYKINWNDEALATKLITEIMTGKRPNMRTLGMKIDGW